MIRKSAVAFSLLLLVASFRINALGLGEIDMISALNQPMSATIGLTATDGVDISQLKIGIASLAAHERLGLTRDKLISKLKFVIGKDGRGSPVIYVSSTEPVREPYLEFLLEMEWENGRMVREYTVLVDPPVTMVAAPAAPVAPVAQAPAIVPAVVEPVARAAPAPRPPVTTFVPAAASKRAATSYGAVRRDEALWSIAKRLRPDNNISIQQMMIALLKANPQAFPDNNINNLKAGSTLTIPERELILELTSDQASAVAGRHYNEWLERRGGGGLTEVAQPAEPEEPVYVVPARETARIAETESQLKLTAPEGITNSGSATSTSEGADSSNDNGVAEVLSQQLALAAEEIEASRAESQELRSRVLELENQIKKMQRLLELKSDALAGLQNQPGMEPQVAAGADIGLAAEEEPSSIADSEATTSSEQAADAVAPANYVERFLTWARGFGEKLMGSPILAGLGALVALLLGVFFWGSRRKDAAAALEDAPATSTDEVISAAGHAADETSAESSLDISESTGHDDNGVELQDSAIEEASDPVTEADVYLAYGRIHQAEDVLQAAIQDEPENLTFRAKLLEVYHASGNVAAFNNAAVEYRELKPEDDEHWDKIATLGYELSPGNDLYSSGLEVAGAADNSVDFDMDLSGMDEIASLDTTTAELDDLAIEVETVTEAVTGESVELTDDLEFTLDESEEDESHGEGLLASTDEVATKLDLARAYLDMEDPEGALSILQEVMEEGSAEQKSEAESLISKIV